jgi:DNA-binding LacI/PurR family transcriptional regulator
MTKMSWRVGVLLPHVGRWWFGEVLAGLEAVFRPADCELILFPVVDEASRAHFFDRLPDSAHLDALVVVAMPLTSAEAARAKAAVAVLGTLGTKLPTVTSVRIDERRGVGLAMEHLSTLGHRRIALISGDPHEPWHFTAARQRRDAYRQFLQRRGLAADPALDVPGYWTVRGGAAAVRRLFALAEPPTAVFALSDEMAIGASHALTRMGMRVPQDVSVCGFDDHPDAETFGLTTVRQPAYDCGARLAAEVVARLRQRQPASQPSAVPAPGAADRGPARSRRSGPVPAALQEQPLRRLASFEHIVHDALTLVPRASTGPAPGGPTG